MLDEPLSEESLPDELCRRFRYMVETRGHLIDFAYDRVGDTVRAISRRWIWGNVHAVVDFWTYSLIVTDWLVDNRPLLLQRSNGEIVQFPSSGQAEALMSGLKTAMVLEDLISAD